MGTGWAGTVATLASSQDGVFSVAQAGELGVHRRQLVRAVHAGTLVRVHADVFGIAGAARMDRARVRAGVLQVRGSTASHESTLLLRGVDRIPSVVALTVDRATAGHTHPGIRVHRFRDLHPDHLTEIAGIPTTTIERAVVDLASVFSRARLDHLLDDLTITRRLTSIGRIGRVLRQVDRRGRDRIGRLPELLAARNPGEPAPRSRLERRVDELVSRTQLPRPLKEHPLPSDQEYRGLVDRCWPEAHLILEIDGRSWHARESAMAADRARDRAAARVGWQTLRVLDEELRDCPDVVVDDLVVAFMARREQLRTAG
jgi:hypothetical protein